MFWGFMSNLSVFSILAWKIGFLVNAARRLSTITTEHLKVKVKVKVSNGQMMNQTSATWTYLIKAQKRDESMNYLHELIKSLFVQVLKLLGKLLRKSHLSRKFLYFINFENWKIFNLRTVLTWNCYCHTLFNGGL